MDSKVIIIIECVCMCFYLAIVSFFALGMVFILFSWFVVGVTVVGFLFDF